MSANERAWLASGSIPWYSVQGGNLMLLINRTMNFVPNYFPINNFDVGTFQLSETWFDTGSIDSASAPADNGNFSWWGAFAKNLFSWKNFTDEFKPLSVIKGK